MRTIKKQSIEKSYHIALTTLFTVLSLSCLPLVSSADPGEIPCERSASENMKSKFCNSGVATAANSVPEPGTFSLIGLGLVGLFGVRWAKSKL